MHCKVTNLATFSCILFVLIALSLQEDGAPKLEQEQDVETGTIENETELIEVRTVQESSNENDDDEVDIAKEHVILKEGDPFSVLATDDTTGCMFMQEEYIPPTIKGSKSYDEDCDPSEPTMRCNVYTKSLVKPRSNSTCLKPTHLVCDTETRKCLCGNEGTEINVIRFQFGTYSGKTKSMDGRCFVRPTFDVIPGIECSPGTKRREIAVEEESELIPLCICENDDDFDKFNSVDPDWWQCGATSIQLNSQMLLLLPIIEWIRFLTFS